MELHAIKRDDIPGFAVKDSPAAKAPSDFLESGVEAAEITGYPYGLNSFSGNLRQIINRNHLPVKVTQRQKRLFLVKQERGSAR